MHPTGFQLTCCHFHLYCAEFSDIKDVYAIVLFERSSKEFHEFPNVYLHRFKQKSDSGLELNLLQNFIFIPLDIYQKIQPIKVKMTTS